MATKKFIIEVEEGRTKCDVCPLFSNDCQSGLLCIRCDVHDLATMKIKKLEDMGSISDGYHTFDELYEYRLLYNASLFNEFAKQGLYDVHKSKKHSDGEDCFGGGWFIVMAELPTGQVSNHYELKDWDLFQLPEKEKANKWDGHTPQDVANRLREFLKMQ